MIREKNIMEEKFKLKSAYLPTGDQPEAIDKLVEGLSDGYRYQTLLGVTGSGKTFTMANIINRTNRPTLVLAHNKTSAAQLCNEFRNFFQELLVLFIPVIVVLNGECNISFWILSCIPVLLRSVNCNSCI